MLQSFYDQIEGACNDNYLMTCEKWRKIFLTLDHEKLIHRFSLQSDDDAIYLRFFHQDYRLDRRTGMITLVEAPDLLLGFNTVMSIYNLFYYAKKDAKVRGTFVPFRQVKRAAPFDPAFQKTVLQPIAQTFSEHCKELEKACIALGGTKIRQGDVGYVIEAFSWMPVTILFWDGDDEFEAQANMLFDADITDYIHEETVCCIASCLASRLAQEAGFSRVDQLLGDSYS